MRLSGKERTLEIRQRKNGGQGFKETRMYRRTRGSHGNGGQLERDINPKLGRQDQSEGEADWILDTLVSLNTSNIPRKQKCIVQ